MKEEIKSLQEQGRTYDIFELILQTGAERGLVPGWSKRLLTSFKMNNFKEIADAIRPSELIYYLFLKLIEVFQLIS